MEMLKLVYPGGQDNEGRLVLNIQLSQPASKEQIETSVKYVLDSFWWVEIIPKNFPNYNFAFQ